MRVSVPYDMSIGPVHAALKEPLYMKFHMEGEVVQDVDLIPGINHRGVEYLGMKRHPLKVIHLAERICGICSAIHQFMFTLATDRAAGIQASERGEYIRVIVQELERIHSHILWAGVAGHEVGFDTILHLTWKVREDIQDVLEGWTGNRVNYAMYTIGGVRRDITPDVEAKLRKSMDYYKSIYSTLEEIFLEDVTMGMRLKDAGVLTYDDAIRLAAVGPTARGSGVMKDVRVTHPFSAYGDLDLDIITPATAGLKANGDVYDKTVVRLIEIKQSIDLIEQCLDNMPKGPITSEPNMAALYAKLMRAEGESIARGEAPRGEDIHYVRLEKKPHVAVWKVRAPTYGNLMALRQMLIGSQIADIPIIVASIDPCIGCMDRVEVVDSVTKKREIMTKQQLHNLSVQKTRRLMR